MAKKPDDNLESFFLKRVKNFKIDYREEDWQNLNEMLDAANAIKAAELKQKLVWIGSGVLLTISIVLLLWMSQNLTSSGADTVETIKDSENNGTEEIRKGPEDNSSETGIIILPGEGNQLGKSRATTGINDTNQAEINGGIKEDGPQNSTSPKVISEDIQGMDIQPDNLMGEVGNNDGNDTSDKYIPVSRNQKSDAMNSALIIEDGEINEENISIIQEPLETVHLNAGAWDLDYHLGDQILISSYPREMSNVPEFRKTHSWLFSLAADNSAVGLSDFDGPAIRAGIGVELYFSSRVSFMLGANYSVKNYTAYGQEYTPAYGFWTGGVVPDQTLGTCNVLDIPANFTYYIPNLHGQSYFLRAGLSSWLMLEEHYYFKYESTDPDLIKYWGGENENYHYLSIVNLSAGFEQPLGNKLSLQAEPYINIPLGGVGFGKVKLYSAGLKITMKIHHYKLGSLE